MPEATHESRHHNNASQSRCAFSVTTGKDGSQFIETVAMSWISVWLAGQRALKYRAVGMQFVITGIAVDRLALCALHTKSSRCELSLWNWV